MNINSYLSVVSLRIGSKLVDTQFCYSFIPQHTGKGKLKRKGNCLMVNQMMSEKYQIVFISIHKV